MAFPVYLFDTRWRTSLVVTQDDQQFFPPYYAAPMINQGVLASAPDIAEVLNQLAGTIDNETMAQLNLQVDQEGLEAEEAARQFLTEQGLISE